MKTDDSTIHNNDITAPCETRTVADTEIAEKASVKKLNTIEKGAVILDLYRVESDPFVGGMGKVFRVHHTGWNVDLALKQPKREMFQNERQKAMFVNECEAWINLGLHPHIVSCYYVREIDGIPSIFSEWMDDGSLKNHITDSETGDLGKLYAGNDETVLERILDISIQFARGLHYAHEQGLIHQDVKPDNVLMSKTGEVKVADFGIAKARSALSGGATFGGQDVGTMVSESGGYTPAYCSPEQAGRKPLTRRTDIWSWAISVLEMFMGGRSWRYGQAVGAGCDDLFDTAYVPLLESVKELLRWCFRENEAERPHDFRIVEEELLKIFKETTGNNYSRPEPKAAADTADSLNNRALSFLDIGKPEEAERCWESALEVDSSHAESLYNRSVYLWQNARIDDVEAISLVESNAIDADYYLAKLNIARGDAKSAVELLKKNGNSTGKIENIKNAMLVEAKRMIESGEGGEPILIVSGGAGHFNSDGSLIITSNERKEDFSIGPSLRLYDLKGKLIHNFEGHTKEINSLCFNSTGDKILSGSKDNTMKLWDVSSRKCISTFEGHYGDKSEFQLLKGFGVLAVCFGLDEKQALSVGWDKNILLWDIITEKNTRIFEDVDDINTVCYSPDASMILTMNRNNKMKLYDSATGSCIYSFENVCSGCFSPDGKYILYGAIETLKLWDINAKECIRIFEGHKRRIEAVCFSQNDKYACSGNFISRKIWNLQTGRCIRTIYENEGEVKSLCFSPDNNLILAGYQDETKIWIVPQEHPLEMSLSQIHSTETSIRQTRLFNSSVDKIKCFIEIKDIKNSLRELENLRTVRMFGDNEAYFSILKKLAKYCVFNNFIHSQSAQVMNWNVKIWRTCFDPVNNRILLCQNFADHHSEAQLWDIVTEKIIHTFKHTGKIGSACFSPDGNMILTGSHDKTIKLWDAATGKLIHSFETQSNNTTFLCFSPDGRRFLAAGEVYNLRDSNHDMTLWDIAEKKCIRTFKGHESWISSICFSPDGSKAITTSREAVRFWDISSGQCFLRIDESDIVNKACFSPDGKKASWSIDNNKIAVWNIDTRMGAHLLFEEHHRDGNLFYTKDMYSYCFSPDGNQIVYGGLETIAMLDLNTKMSFYQFNRNTELIDSVCFSKDGRKLFTASESKIIIYELDYDLHFPGWADWDEGARPYLNIFMKLHPDWTDDDFEKILIPDLQNRGFGWLRSEGVRAQLEADRLWNQLTDL